MSTPTWRRILLQELLQLHRIPHQPQHTGLWRRRGVASEKAFSIEERDTWMGCHGEVGVIVQSRGIGKVFAGAFGLC